MPSDREIEQLRNYGKRHIPPKSSGGYWAMVQDAKLTKEHAHDLSKKNRCLRCHTVKSKRGECLC